MTLSVTANCAAVDRPDRWAPLVLASMAVYAAGIAFLGAAFGIVREQVAIAINRFVL